MTGKIIQRFDSHLRATDDGLKNAISGFVTYLETREEKLGGRTRGRKVADREKLHLAIEALLSNLVVAYARSPKTLLNVPLSNNTLRGSPRYRPVVYGKHFRDLITLMVNLHLIEIVTKGHNVREWRRREITTIRPTANLLKAFPPIVTVAHNAFTRIDLPEVIVLKGSDGRLLDYSDNDDTRRWRNEMQTINTCLREASITIVGSPDALLDESGFTVRSDVRALRRIWNNGKWTQGGRLYDGFWQTMKRDQRLRIIRIDGGPIANVDFSQFNLRLAYALAKIRPPRGDLYATGNDVRARNWEQLREGRKKLTNAMFNRSKPLTGWPGQTVEERKALAACFPPGTTARDATSEIRSKHSAIAGYFENARGLGFMRIESDILVATLLSLMKRGITALPLHDAVLVPERHALTAKATLQREAKRRIGTAIPAEIKMADG